MHNRTTLLSWHCFDVIRCDRRKKCVVWYPRNWHRLVEVENEASFDCLLSQQHCRTYESMFTYDRQLTAVARQSRDIFANTL